MSEKDKGENIPGTQGQRPDEPQPPAAPQGEGDGQGSEPEGDNQSDDNGENPEGGGILGPPK